MCEVSWAKYVVLGFIKYCYFKNRKEGRLHTCNYTSHPNPQNSNNHILRNFPSHHRKIWDFIRNCNWYLQYLTCRRSWIVRLAVNAVNSVCLLRSLISMQYWWIVGDHKRYEECHCCLEDMWEIHCEENLREGFVSASASWADGTYKTERLL